MFWRGVVARVMGAALGASRPGPSPPVGSGGHGDTHRWWDRQAAALAGSEPPPPAGVENHVWRWIPPHADLGRSGGWFLQGCLEEVL